MSDGDRQAWTPLAGHTAACGTHLAQVFRHLDFRCAILNFLISDFIIIRNGKIGIFVWQLAASGHGQASLVISHDDRQIILYRLPNTHAVTGKLNQAEV